MDRSLRILHLEDDPADAELIAATLAADGLVCHCTRVSSRAQFVEAIDAAWDLILGDFAMPGFDGVTAQQIARERRPDVPFVFVSGTIGEEVAIERLKAGATDYVLKQRLARLPSAIRRALQEADERRERRRAESEVRRLNAELEQRVVERTAQLAAANRALAQRERELEDAKAFLQRTNDFLDSVVEHLPVMLFVKDARDLRYVRFNRAGEEMLGMSRSDLIGRTDDEVFPIHLAAAFTAADRNVLAGRSVVEIPEEIVASQARGPRVVHTKKIPICDAGGEPLYLLGISEDVTERKVAQEAARLSRLEAERASRAKSEFLSRMSHDLRTPLNAILGFAQLLEMDPLSPEQADSVKQILRGGSHLLELINEVLDIARIEAGHLTLSPEPVAVGEVVPQVVDLVRPLAAASGIRVSTDLASACPHVHADRQRLKQVLLNFIANAVKYNRPRGSVTVSCAAVAGRVRISVRDTGAGIPEEKRALLFQPFERLGADQGGIEGTGLGLAVSKGLTEAMGGTIGVESEIDVGSTFWIELPQDDAPARAEVEAPPSPVPTAAATSGTILYVEDNRSNVRLLERLLGRRRGVHLVTAASGEAALDRARRHRPDLILLDLHLPDIPGEEVLRRLWADPATRPIPVAILSADATASQSQRLLAAGAVAYLTKPLQLTGLLRLLDERLPSVREA
jgi:PAS domain S-box-containing protein